MEARAKLLSFWPRFLCPRAGTSRTQFTGRYVVPRTYSTVRCVGPQNWAGRFVINRTPIAWCSPYICISALDGSFFVNSDMTECNLALNTT